MTPTGCLLDEAIRLHQAGYPGQAAAMYQRLLDADPDHHPSLHLLGLIAQQDGRTQAAIGMVGRAIVLQPAAAHYRNTLATALRSAGLLPEAAAQLRLARGLRPGSAEIASNLGSVLTELQHWPEAVAVLRDAVALDRDLADAHYNLANALCWSGEPEAALASYAACLALRPDFREAHFNCGHALAAVGRPEEAAARYRELLRLDPGHVDALNNLGVLLHAADRPEAEDLFAAALRLRPADPGIGCNLAAARLAQGRTGEALADFAAVLAADPDHGAARLGRLVAHLPVVPRDAAEAAAGRAAYAAELAALDRAASARPALRDALARAVGTAPPFFLAYQGEDDLDLQRQYGALMHRLMGSSAAAPRAPAARLRIGIVSGFFCEHTVWTLFLDGWLRHLDRGKFQLFGYHTGARRDACTAMAAQMCDRFVAGARSAEAWRAAVLADAPDILLYPEIGMDPASARLAAQRLASVQCVAWGHPVTTGLPSIDCFLSSALMEPEGAAAHYTERLVRLPNLGIACTPAAGRPCGEPKPDRGAFGLRRDAVVYWSGQNLAKYQPRDDEVFARIALQVPGCQFVFIAFGRGTAMTRRFADRLDRAFARFGLRADAHCAILPQLSQADFLAAASLCDVVLDSIGWSGGKSTLDLLALDPAIVTLPGRFLRGRHTAAILERMGAAETIAGSVDEYISMAVRLGRDEAFRQDIRARVAAGKHRVFGDRAAITALEDVLLAAI